MYTFVFGDIHGKPEALRRLLQAAGVVNDADERNALVCLKTHDEFAPYKVVSVGDLLNGVLEDANGDEQCLLRSSSWVDKLVMGNHESGYVFNNMGFNGFTSLPHLASAYRSLAMQGKVVPAVLVGETLVTHAGVVEQFQFLTASSAYKAIMNTWENYTRPEFQSEYFDFPNFVDIPKYLLLDGIGRRRGGNSPVSGILWADWKEPKNFFFNQIMGHTPMPEGPVHTTYATQGTFTINIDAGGKSGYNPWGVWLDSDGRVVQFITAPEDDEDEITFELEED